MSDKISGTSIDQKLKAKKAAHQIKFGSPKLRDLLREVCINFHFLFENDAY